MRITRNDLNDVTRTVAHDTWTALNDAGEGFAVGNEADEITAIEGLGELQPGGAADDDVAVYIKDNTATIVADSNGPWAVEVEIDWNGTTADVEADTQPCADCGAPAWYCDDDEQWFHVDPARECFLAEGKARAA